MTTGERWLAIGVGAATLFGSAAHVVARFNTLENARDRQVEEIVELKQKTVAIEQRLLALEVEKETMRNISDVRKDVEVLKVRVDALYGGSRRRGQ